MENADESEAQSQTMRCSKRDFDLKLRKLRLLVHKLPVGDQLMLYRNHQYIQKVCDNIWRNTHKRLDFRLVEQELTGEALSYFLNIMVDNFRYVYFTAERLQENLNVLERAGVKALNNVLHCELLMTPEPPSKRPRDIGGGDAGQNRIMGIAAVLGGTVMPQWPLHALPKMLRNLRRLKVYCDVQVHFIEQFSMLELLVLHGDVSQSALTGILERCKHLKRLFIRSQKVPPNLQGIASSLNLEDISVPMPLFQSARDQVLALPELHLLELTGGREFPVLTIECIRFVIDTKAEDVEIFQLNCGCFDGPYWMRETGLGRCPRLQGLVLNKCCFKDREITELHMPRVVKYLVLSGCHDLKEYQLLDMIKLCPTLSELYLIDCPLLTGKVLYDIYRIRCSEKLEYPISIILSRCDSLSDEYQETVSALSLSVHLSISFSLPLSQYADYWYFKLSVVKLDRLIEENRPIEDMQVFFYKQDHMPE